MIKIKMKIKGSVYYDMVSVMETCIYIPFFFILERRGGSRWRNGWMNVRMNGLGIYST